MSSAKRTLLFWLPSIFDSVGGIQYYSRKFAEELSKAFVQSKSIYYLKNDRAVPERNLLPVRSDFRCFGKVPQAFRTPIYLIALFVSALFCPRPFIICGHTHFLPIAYLLKRLFGIPYWVICYGVESWEISRFGIRSALTHADKVVCISEFTKEKILSQIELETSTVVVIPCTFEEERFFIHTERDSVRTKYSFNSEDRILLTVNRLEAKESFKAYEQVLKSFPALEKRIPSLKYVIVGDGSDRLRLEDKIMRDGLQGKVRLTGYVSDEELVDYYNLCDLFVMPSKLEGFGIVYLEALACGKPVLGGNKDGAQEALRGGELGMLVDPDSESELEEAIVDFFENRNGEQRFGAARELREKVIHYFGAQAFSSNIARLARSLEETS